MSDGIVEIEYCPRNLTPENIYTVYQQFCEAMAEETDNVFIKNPLACGDWINFKKLDKPFLLHIDVPTIFGNVRTFFYFHHTLTLTIEQYGEWNNVTIDLRDRPFPEHVHVSREENCSHFHDEVHRWAEGGSACPIGPDGSKRVANICPNCYRVRYDFGSRMRILYDRLFDTFVPKWR